MISFLAWTGFVVSFFLHVSSFFEPKFSTGIIFLMHGLCILLVVAARSASGNSTRGLSRADCSGLAAGLQIVFQAYAFLTFCWPTWLGHDRGSSEAMGLRTFSAFWMPFFLTSASLMARRSPGRVSW